MRRGEGGQAADREASSCNAPQLPRFLVIFIIILRGGEAEYCFHRRPSVCVRVSVRAITGKLENDLTRYVLRCRVYRSG